VKYRVAPEVSRAIRQRGFARDALVSLLNRLTLNSMTERAKTVIIVTPIIPGAFGYVFALFVKH